MTTLKEVYDKSVKKYDSLIGKKIRIHTDKIDTIEGIMTDYLLSMNESDHELVLWWIKLSNNEKGEQRSFYILANIDVIEVIEDEDVENT